MKSTKRIVSITTLFAFCFLVSLSTSTLANAKWYFFKEPNKTLEFIYNKAFPWKQNTSLEATPTFGDKIHPKMSEFLKGKLKLINQKPPHWQYIKGLIFDQHPSVDVRHAINAIKGSSSAEDIIFKVEVQKYGKIYHFPVPATFSPDTGILSIPRPRIFEPGLYTVTIVGSNPVTGLSYSFEQDMVWGVLAMNTDQDRYRPYEKAHVAFGVLNELGKIVCDAQLSLTITAPSGAFQILSTRNGQINSTSTCGKKQAGLIDPDYEAYFTLTELGDHQLHLEAETDNGIWTISTKVNVTDKPPIIIKRQAATRLWPIAPSPVTIDIEFLQNYNGTISELVPKSFVVSKIDPPPVRHYATNKYQQTELEIQYLIWRGKWKAGETARFTYEYDAPDVSPEFYLLGPIELQNITEQRVWQIANDDPPAVGYGNNFFYFLGGN